MSKFVLDMFDGIFDGAPVGTITGPNTGANSELRATRPVFHPQAEPLLLVYAAEFGAAENAAVDTADLLNQRGIRTETVEFYDFTLEHLLHARQALFIISTYVCGSAPDMAENFQAQAMAQPAALSRLNYGLLAIGDRIYDDDYCRFGYEFDHWLKASGATPWFDLIDVDDENPDDLKRWDDALGALVRNAAA